MDILKQAKEAAEETLADPTFVQDPVFPALRQRVQAMFRDSANIFN